MLGIEIILIIVIALGLIFALTNGLHDASSVVATVISCGAASPSQAVIMASVFGLAGAVFGGSKVAETMTKLIDVPAKPALLTVLLAALLGAVLWNAATWKWGLPSSSSHALVGGIIGAVCASYGYRHVFWGANELIRLHQLAGVLKVAVSLVLSPVLGFVLAYLFEKISQLALRNANFNINKHVKRAGIVNAALLAYSHGANDTQKITGILVLALGCARGAAVETAPAWVRLCGGFLMFLGTMLGGWGIMKTIGRRIYELRPIHSLNSQLASMAAVFGATFYGAPVSTTHVVVGSVAGVGAAEEYKLVHWSIIKEIVIAWFVTIPSAAAVSAIIYILISFIIKL